MGPSKTSAAFFFNSHCFAHLIGFLKRVFLCRDLKESQALLVSKATLVLRWVVNRCSDFGFLSPWSKLTFRTMWIWSIGTPGATRSNWTSRREGKPPPPDSDGKIRTTICKAAGISFICMSRRDRLQSSCFWQYSDNPESQPGSVWSWYAWAAVSLVSYLSDIFWTIEDKKKKEFCGSLVSTRRKIEYRFKKKKRLKTHLVISSSGH